MVKNYGVACRFSRIFHQIKPLPISYHIPIIYPLYPHIPLPYAMISPLLPHYYSPNVVG